MQLMGSRTKLVVHKDRQGEGHAVHNGQSILETMGEDALPSLVETSRAPSKVVQMRAGAT